MGKKNGHSGVKTTLGNVLTTVGEKFTTLGATINFSDPKNLLTYQGESGKIDMREFRPTEENFRLQIGKMLEKGETLYRKELLLPALEVLLQHLQTMKEEGKEGKITIQLRPDLARYLDDEPEQQTDKILSYKQEKQRIRQWIRNISATQGNDIYIIDAANSYPEIFRKLEAEGKGGIIPKEQPVLDPEHFSALQIVEYLAWTALHNEKLGALFYNTKPKEKKDEETKNGVQSFGERSSDFYAIVEVGIRLYEVLNGISTQGGVDRQKMYDTIIGGILYWKDMGNFKTKHYPELKELHDFCQQINPNAVFERLWIDMSKVEEKEKKEKTYRRLKRQALRTSAEIALVLALVIGGGKFYQTNSQLKQENEKYKRQSELVRTELGDKPIYPLRYGDVKSIEKTNQDFNDLTINILGTMKSRYIITPAQEELLINIIKNELLRSNDAYGHKNIDMFMFSQGFDGFISNLDHFVTSRLVPNNKTLLESLGIDTTNPRSPNGDQ